MLCFVINQVLFALNEEFRNHLTFTDFNCLQIYICPSAWGKILTVFELIVFLPTREQKFSKWKIIRYFFKECKKGTLTWTVFVFNLIFFADEKQTISTIAIIPLWILKYSITSVPYLQTIFVRQIIRLTSSPIAEYNWFPIPNPMKTIIKTKICARCSEVFTFMSYSWCIETIL